MLCVFDHVMNQFPKEFRMKYKDQCLLKESHFQLMYIGYVLKNTIKTIVQILKIFLLLEMSLEVQCWLIKLPKRASEL